MKFEIIKEIKLDGTTYYLIYTTSEDCLKQYHKLFSTEDEAYEYMSILVDNYKVLGYPKEEVIYSQTF